MKVPSSFAVRLTALIGAVAMSALAVRHCAAGESIPREALPYQRTLIANARSVWGMNAPVAVIAAQIHQESRWRKDAHSQFASGLAQFTPATAEWIAHEFPDDVGFGEPTNPAWALRAVARYDRYLWERVSGRTPCDRWSFTLSGYNGGPGWVSKDKRLARASGADPEVWFDSVEKYNAGRAPQFFQENRGYPRRILLVLQPLYVNWGEGVVCVKS